jgi:hypothetical protein
VTVLPNQFSRPFDNLPSSINELYLTTNETLKHTALMGDSALSIGTLSM